MSERLLNAVSGEKMANEPSVGAPLEEVRVCHAEAGTELAASLLPPPTGAPGTGSSQLSSMEAQSSLGRARRGRCRERLRTEF